METVGYLLTPEYAPFAAALGLMLALAALEALGVGFSTLTDGLDLDFDGPEGPHGPLSWLGLGTVPAGVLLVTFLLIFGGAGIVVQRISDEAFRAWPLAASLLLPSLLLNAAIARAIKPLMPKDQTYAVRLDDLLGRYATLQFEATDTSPGRAVVRDEYGQEHYVRVAPHDFGLRALRPQEEVLLVRREDDVFYGIPRQGTSMF